jgi:FkbM family methyltransferase
MKVFLDVGAHVGQTLRAVLDPGYRFDKVYCFEPSQACLHILTGFADRRVTILPFGLWKQTSDRKIYDPGSIGASIFDDKPNTGFSETASFVRASDWFRNNVSPGYAVYLKLNCEGSECDILDDLIDSGEIHKVDYAMIHFDVRKIPSQRHREAEVTNRLRELGIRYWEAGDVMKGPSHVARVQNWLDAIGAREASLTIPERLRSYLHRARYTHAPGVVQALRLGPMARRLLPSAAYARVKLFIYPEIKRTRSDPQSSGRIHD